MTEDEAKTKWCPYTRVFVSTNKGISSFNKHSDENDRFDKRMCCIASECMMWRTGKMKISEFVEMRNGSIYKESYEAKDIGWCGLAGKPE